MNDDEDYERKLNYYLEIGAIEIAGINDEGEVVFEVKEKAKEIAPELWESHAKYVDSILLDLYKKDLIEVEYDENLNATIKISQEGFESAKEAGLIDPNFYPEEDL